MAETYTISVDGIRHEKSEQQWSDWLREIDRAAAQHEKAGGLERVKQGVVLMEMHTLMARRRTGSWLRWLNSTGVKRNTARRAIIMAARLRNDEGGVSIDKLFEVLHAVSPKTYPDRATFDAKLVGIRELEIACGARSANAPHGAHLEQGSQTGGAGVQACGVELPPPFDHGQEAEIGEDDDWLANSEAEARAAGFELDDVGGGDAGRMQAAGSARPVEVEGAGGDFRVEISDLKRGMGGEQPRTPRAVAVPRGRDIPGQMSMADLYRKTRDWFEIGTRRVDAGSMTAAQAAAVCRAMEEIFGAEGGEE